MDDNKPNKIRELHHKAMRLVDEADKMRRIGYVALVNPLIERAYELELESAGLSATEPSRSVLYRSAATLAWRCGRYGDAREAIKLGCTDATHPEIRDEFHDLLKQLPESTTL